MSAFRMASVTLDEVATILAKSQVIDRMDLGHVVLTEVYDPDHGDAIIANVANGKSVLIKQN